MRGGPPPGRLVWLAVGAAIGTAVLTTPTMPDGPGRIAGLALLSGCGLAWLTWCLSDDSAHRTAAASLVAVTIIGAALAGIAFPGPAIALAGIGAARLGQRLEPRAAGGVVLAATAIFIAVASGRGGGVLGFAIIIPGALMVGLTRRQYVLRAEEAEMRAADAERAREEHAVAAALAERTRMAREIHDVLAHSLAALSVQLEAADALLDDNDATGARQHVQRAQALAADGIAETQRAVRALRDDVIPLQQRLESLVQRSAESGLHAALQINGTARPLAADADLALYRAAQEGLTNAARYGDGTAQLELAFDAGSVRLCVSNPVTDPHPRASKGSGWGIAGLRERCALLGGTIDAGPEGTNWRLHMVLPA